MVESHAKALFAAPTKRDDWREQIGKNLALRSFIGCQKRRNEDFGALKRVTIDDQTYSIIIVSDGVSTAWLPHFGAKAACIAARDTIASLLRAGNKDLRACLTAAVSAAQKAVRTIPAATVPVPEGYKTISEATFLAGITCGDKAEFVWAGDCRAYLLPQSGGARLLTKDHSWINVMVDARGMSVAEALQTREAHWITQCLGTEEEDFEPSFASVDVGRSKMLLLCSDGFWNYAHPRQDQRATPLLDQIYALPPDCDAATIASRLVDFACESGGHDNITVAVLKM